MTWGFSAINILFFFLTRSQHRQGENFKKDKLGALFKYKWIWWECISYWASVHFIRVTLWGPQSKRGWGGMGIITFFLLKLFSMWVMLASETWKEFIWARMCAFPIFFSWDKLHWMMQNLIHTALSTICFLWLKILNLLVRELGKNSKAMHYGSACRSILNDNHFLIQLGP